MKNGLIAILNIQAGQNNTHLKKRLSIIILFVWCVTTLALAQNDTVVSTSTQSEKEITFVYLENSEKLIFDQNRLPDAQVLIGDVLFRHDSVLMYCDSAYFYEKKNSLDAFGNVRILQGDSMTIYGDLLFYDGNTRIARLRKNVKLDNKSTTVTTDSLNYHRDTEIAYYFNGGEIKDSLNTLTSIIGTYYSNTDVAYFKNNVKLTNINFDLYSDSLKYNTQTKIADLVDTTKIIYQKETTINANGGWYNTENENSQLLYRSEILHDDGKTMIGDTILYDKKIKNAEVWGNMELCDSVQKATLYGNYGQYNEVTEVGFATKEPLFVDWSNSDSIFIHADSLYVKKDSTYNLVLGYNKVRLFKTDAQMVCDSLAYSERDSIINLYYDPIMWNGNTQISGDFVQAFILDGAIDKAYFTGKAISIRQVDANRFDQLSGKEIIAHMDSGVLSQVDVDGNAETIFYPAEEDGTLLGVNKTVSSFIKMFFKNETIDRAIFTTETTGTMYPLGQLSKEEARLSTFFWAEQERPKSKMDLFSDPEKTVRATGTKSAASTPKGNKKNKSDAIGKRQFSTMKPMSGE